MLVRARKFIGNKSFNLKIFWSGNKKSLVYGLILILIGSLLLIIEPRLWEFVTMFNIGLPIEGTNMIPFIFAYIVGKWVKPFKVVRLSD